MLTRRRATTHIAKNSYGFSLVELLVVVAILAILSAIAIPLFLNQKAKAKSATLRSDLHNLIMETEGQRPNTPGTAFASAATLQTTITTSGYKVSTGSGGRNIAAIVPNCKFGGTNSAVVSNGDYIIRGYVDNGSAAAVTGTTLYQYDSATGVWEEYIIGSTRWNNINAVIVAGTCNQAAW